jgi:hypothetical protein
MRDKITMELWLALRRLRLHVADDSAGRDTNNDKIFLSAFRFLDPSRRDGAQPVALRTKIGLFGNSR